MTVSLLSFTVHCVFLLSHCISVIRTATCGKISPILKMLWTTHNVPEHYTNFESVPQSSGMFSNIPQYLKMFWNVLECSRLFSNILEMLRLRNFQPTYLQKHALQIYTRTFLIDVRRLPHHITPLIIPDTFQSFSNTHIVHIFLQYILLIMSAATESASALTRGYKSFIPI